jgi:thymidylate synthase (FAD)
MNANAQTIIGIQFPVLDKGYVELQDMMGDDLAVVNAARTSFLGESKGPEKDKQLLFYLVENRHHTPLEQVTMKFRVKMPLMATIQLLRHRTFSFNSSSGRYLEFEANEFYVPTAWREQSSNNKQGSDGYLDTVASLGYYKRLQDHIDASYRLYEQALHDGVAKELSRVFLPAYALYFTLVFTVDARNLLHFLNLRMDSHAQYEIREYAKCIYEQVFKPIMPWTSEAFELYKDKF